MAKSITINAVPETKYQSCKNCIFDDPERIDEACFTGEMLELLGLPVCHDGVIYVVKAKPAVKEA